MTRHIAPLASVLLAATALSACANMPGADVFSAGPAAAASDVEAPDVTVATDAAAPEPVVWDLTTLFATPDDWAAERDALIAAAPELAKYKGTLGDSPAALADALETISAFNKRSARLYVYASTRADEDTRLEANLAARQEASQILTSAGEATAYVDPEVLALGADKIERFIADEPRLGVHAVGLRETLRSAPYTLSEDGERILAAATQPLGGPNRIYNQLSNSDMPRPTLTIDGEEATLTNQGYVRHRQHPDREVRKEVFDAFWGSWSQFETTMGQALGANTQAQVFNAKARGFDTAREAALFRDALPVSIYDQLIAQARAGLPTLHRYFSLRGRMLDIETPGYHDIYPQLVTLDASYDLETSERLTLDALEPFGPEYLDALKLGFESDWTHAYPQEGKRSGAYVTGWAYDEHPFVFLNHQGTYDSLSTFAHEWGHAVHSVLANAAQPWETAPYSIFVAEMASTINEVLLLRRLYSQATTNQERLFFLGQELEMYRGTFFRQTMFAEFEKAIHDEVEAGAALTGGRMSEIYLELLNAYHGHEEGVMDIDPDYAIEWAYIPHFYYDFYVFQYATSVAASTLFAERLLAGEEGAQEAVIDMLKKGGSEHPHDMFRAAGVDLESPEPYQAVITRMNVIMDEMETLLDAQ